MLKCVLIHCLCFVLLHILGSNGEPAVLVRSNGGGTARLECRFSTTSVLGATVLWKKDGREKIVNVTDCTGDAITTCQVPRSSLGKYAVEGRLSTGVTLIISNVGLEDDGMYDCKAVLIDGIVEKSFRLAVTYVPDEIAITDVVKGAQVSNMSTLYAVVDRPYVLNCTVPSPCNPPANISWSFGDVTALVYEQANHSSALDSPLVTSSKSMELTASEENTGKTISCIAMHYGLTAPLWTNVMLEVGRLPDSPLNAEDWISSVTVNSFTVTWSHRSSGGKPQRFTVTYCVVVRPKECSEIISRIGETRTRIENLRPFTLYRVTVKSHTVYGFSEDNEFIEKSTLPMSPKELGVEGVYNSQLDRADIVRVSNITGPLPDGLCFQLVDQGFEPSTDAADAAGQDCVNVGQYLAWPQGKYWTQMALVAYGNSVFSATSMMTGTETGVSLPVVIGASVGGSVLLIIILIIIYVRTKGRSSGNARANRRLPAQPQQTRQQPGRGQNVPNDEPPPTYSGVKYQEVTDPPRSAGPLGELYTTHHSYHQAQAPQEVSGIPAPGYGNGQYYSRSITMDKKTAVAEFSDRYGYMDPIP